MARRKTSNSNRISEIDGELKEQVEKLKALRSDVDCYPFLLRETSITGRVVDDVYDDLRKEHQTTGGCIDVIVDSSGGDIDATYNLALLFRRFGAKHLEFIVPRWAKSAATMLVCAGDRILMTPVAELGPVDPQITTLNPLEGRLEQFSPLHIESTLSLIRNEYEDGSKELADGLIKRLQFPLTLGSYTKSLDIGKEYLSNLLSTRMLKKHKKKVPALAKKLTRGYADHGYCIDVEEAKAIGLVAEELPEDQLEIVWTIHRLSDERRRLQRQEKRKEIEKTIKGLPPELIEKLPVDLLAKPDKEV